MTTHLYRAEITAYESYVACYMHRYDVVKETRCGVWIEFYPGSKRKFVNLQADRKWAWPTEAEAMYSLKRRKQRQHAILESQLATVERYLDALNDGITHECVMYQGIQLS